MARKRSPSRNPPPVQRLLLRLSFALARAVTKLPFAWQWRLAGWCGSALAYLPLQRIHIARVNLKLCFPTLSERALDRLLRANIRSTMIGVIESLFAWFGDPQKLRQHTTLVGAELLHQAQARGQGVLLLGAHLSTLDLAGALLAQDVDLDVVYRYNKNLMIEELMTKSRQRYYRGVIEREDPRTIVRSLREGRTVWFAADQDFGRKHSVFSPFFGVNAATTIAPVRLAQASGAIACFFEHQRAIDAQGQWRLKLVISPLPASWLSAPGEEAARLVNAEIERAIAGAPDQYLWMHRRFKTRPEGEQRPY